MAHLQHYQGVVRCVSASGAEISCPCIPFTHICISQASKYWWGWSFDILSCWSATCINLCNMSRLRIKDCMYKHSTVNLRCDLEHRAFVEQSLDWNHQTGMVLSLFLNAFDNDCITMKPGNALKAAVWRSKHVDPNEPWRCSNSYFMYMMWRGHILQTLVHKNPSLAL